MLVELVDGTSGKARDKWGLDEMRLSDCGEDSLRRRQRRGWACCVLVGEHLQERSRCAAWYAFVTTIFRNQKSTS